MSGAQSPDWSERERPDTLAAPMQSITLVELLRALVRIPSVNPEFAEDPAHSGEKALADYVAERLAGVGFSIEWHEVLAGRPNLVARYGPSAPRRSLLFEAHLDTQGVQGMTIPPFEGFVRNGRLYGRGACDTKGPMAAALWALTPARLEALAAAGVSILFVGAIGEEKGNVGALQLVEKGIGADEAIILEPTDAEIVCAHKGTLWLEIETVGRAAHGSTPQDGVNAIEGMIEVIQRLPDAMAVRVDTAHPLLGRPTLNIGTIRGGASINMVPAFCRIEVDRRTLPGEDHAALVEAVKRLIERLTHDGRLAGGEVRVIKDGPPFETAVDSPLVRRLAGACEAVHCRPRIVGAGWFSDAGPFSKTCRSIAVFGPGSIRQAHTADEYIDLEALREGATILGHFLDRLAEETRLAS